MSGTYLQLAWCRPLPGHGLAWHGIVSSSSVAPPFPFQGPYPFPFPFPLIRIPIPITPVLPVPRME